MTISNMPDYIEVFGMCLHETAEAVMFDFGIDKNVWIPKSLMEDWPDSGDTGSVLMKEWIALEKGLI